MSYSGIRTGYSVKKYEKIDLNSRNLTWKALPDMTEVRCTFNPNLFKEYVYLCGGRSYRMEVFFPKLTVSSLSHTSR